MDYLHFDPVKHGHVTQVADWPYSTFRRMLETGAYPYDWAGNTAADGAGEMGKHAAQCPSVIAPYVSFDSIQHGHETQVPD